MKRSNVSRTVLCVVYRGGVRCHSYRRTRPVCAVSNRQISQARTRRHDEASGGRAHFVFAVVLTLHLIEASLWAAFYYFRGLFADFETSLYFSLVTFGTMGSATWCCRSAGVC